MVARLLVITSALSRGLALARSRGGEGGLLGVALVVGAIGLVIWLFGRLLAPNQSTEARAFIGLFALAGIASLVEIVKTFF